MRFAHVIILLLIQYLCQRPLSRKNMHFSINYIVSVPPFCICACFFLIKALGRNIELRVKFQLLIKLKYRQMKKFLALSLSDAVFIILINVKMPTIVGILTFMSRINFVLS